MAGRKLSFEPKTALNQMMLVFWRNGFNATSMDDLCRAVGVPKPSIYSYFGDKEMIFIKALETYNSGCPQVHPENWRMDYPLKERLSQLMLAKNQCDMGLGSDLPSGCLMVNTITEFMGISQKIDDTIIKFSKTNEAGLRKFFELAKANKELKKSGDPAMLAAQVSIFLGGIAVMRKAGGSRKKVKKHIEDFAEMIC